MKSRRAWASFLPVLAAVVGLGLGSAPAAVDAQQARPGAGPPGAPADTVELVFEREVFQYPAFQRRNPFRPLTGDDAGPRFEELVLLGVILADERAGSVALLGPRMGTGAARGEGARNWRVREGDLLGNIRVMVIRQREILVEVDEFGVREPRVLELRRTEPQAEEAGEVPEGVEAPDEDPPAPPPGGGGAADPPPDTVGVSGGNGRSGGSA